MKLTRRVTVLLTDKMYFELKRLAKSQSKTISSVIRGILSEAIKENRNK